MVVFNTKTERQAVRGSEREQTAGRVDAVGVGCKAHMPSERLICLTII